MLVLKISIYTSNNVKPVVHLEENLSVRVNFMTGINEISIENTNFQ